MKREHHTLEIVGNTEEDNTLQASLQELQACTSEGELDDLLCRLLDLARQRPIIIRYTKKSFTTPKLVIFDLDSTLVRAEFMAHIGMAEERDLERKEKLMLLTREALNGEGEWRRNFAQRVRLLKGMEVELLKSYYQELPLSEGAKELMAMLRSYKVPTAIVSGAWRAYVQYIAEYLQIDESFGSVWEHNNGVLTGNIVGEPMDPQAKARVMQELADKYGITTDEIVVIADGYNDVPMMSKAGCSFMIFTTQTPSPSLAPIVTSLKVDFITT